MYSYLNCNNNEVPEDYYPKKIQEIDEELQLCFGGAYEYNNENVYKLINGNKYQINIIINEADVLFNVAKKLWRQAEDVILSESCNPKFDILSARSKIVDFLILCRYSILECRNTSCKSVVITKLLHLIDVFKSSMCSISDLEDFSLTKLVSSGIKIPGTSVATYFHMYFDVRWLILTIEQLCEKSVELVQCTFQNILSDIICLSYKLFQKSQPFNGLQKHPFVCKCVKETLLMLQQFSEICFGGIEKFWQIYNSVTKPYEELFCFWILYYTASLRCYTDTKLGVSENLTHIDQNLKSLLSRSEIVENETLKQSLELIQPILNDYWLSASKIEPYLLLWDFFYKHLNDMEFKRPKSSVCFIEHLDKISSGYQKSTYHPFDIFLRMLITHLKQHPNHWSKLRGRIYSRLPAHKLKDFNEKGICNISLFFMMLSDVYFEETITKLQEILQNFIVEKRNAEQIWIIRLSMITLYVKRKRSIDPAVVAPLLKLLEDASTNREQFYLFKMYVEGLDYIINISSNLQLNQSMLFGKWITKYIQSCQLTDLCYLLNTITWTVENTYREGVWFEWSDIFLNNVLPGLKQTSMTSSAPSQIGKLAALIVKNAPESLSQHISYFTGDLISPKVSSQFLSVLLEDYPENRIITPAQEQIIIQAWIRCCLFNTENNDQLSDKVIKFSVFSCLEVRNIFQEPFLSLIKAIHNQATNQLHTFRLKEVCDVCFGQIDRNIITYLSNPASEACTLHLYTNMGSLFFYCSSLLYYKTKSNCLLSRLINILLLPTEVLMGKPPNTYILRAIEKTWHLFFQGIFNLGYSVDPFLERTLKDLVVRFLPFFIPTVSPFFNCLDNIDNFSFILDKMNSSFISHSSKSSDENTFKALKIVHAALEKSNRLELVKVVVQKALLGILEVIMFHSHKAAAVEVLKLLALSEFYVQIRAELKYVILCATEKHLAFSSTNYFQLVYTLVKLVPLDMKDLLPDIKKQIVIVERMRGVGFDNTLRLHLDRIESSLSV